MESLKNKYLFGLLGKDISYSFSRSYFTEKFESLGYKEYQYQNFDLQKITLFPDLLKQYQEVLLGMNVTIPYKESLGAYIHEIDDVAATIGAVNTLKFLDDGTIKGFNTDYYGFEKALLPKLKKQHQKALILGTGGASKAIKFTLKKLGIEYQSVSRTKNLKTITYEELDEEMLNKHQLIINSTPLGTYPSVNEKPPIPYQFISRNHYLFDLIYNPSVSQFLKEGKNRGASIQNGYEMLIYQAEKSWEIWNVN